MSDPNRPSVIERAIALARSGMYSNVGAVRDVLKRERYESVEAHISGSLSKQITALCRASQPGAAQQKEQARG
jgi:hypothetical protein